MWDSSIELNKLWLLRDKYPRRCIGENNDNKQEERGSTSRGIRQPLIEKGEKVIFEIGRQCRNAV